MSDNDSSRENRLGTKIARYGRVSGAMAGLATKLAGEKFLGLKIEREEHARQLMTALGNLKGPLMKVGQILSTIPEALPPEYARAMQQLQSDAPPMGWPFVRRRMKTELGADWQSRFERFDREASAAASLGQVHKAIADISQLKSTQNETDLEESASQENLPQKSLQKETERNSGYSSAASVNVHKSTCEPEAQNGRDCSPFIDEGPEEGQILACKLQYPDMKSAIETDLHQLKIIFSVYERYDPSIKTNHIYAELAERLYEELDYEREAKHCRLYEYMLREEPNVHVPRVVSALSTDRLLTTTWLEGRKILEYKDKNEETRAQIALNMFRAWYVPLYHYGVIHGDPHLGNYTVRDDLSINLLDFGCVRVFPPEFVGGVIDLYRALQSDNRDLAVHAYETWGFKNLSAEQIDTLNIWASFLYGPILEDKERVIGHADGAVYGRETAEKVHKKLRELARENGSVVIPREFVFMDRAALGLGSVFIHLNAKVNWYRLFNELIEGFDPKIMRENQQNALQKFNLA